MPQAAAPRARGNQRPTEDRTTFPPTTTARTATARAHGTSDRPMTARGVPKRRCNEEQRRVRSAHLADQRPHDVPSNNDATSSSVACALHPWSTDDRAVRAALPADRRPHDVPPNNDGTSSSAACARQPAADRQPHDFSPNNDATIRSDAFARHQRPTA